MSIYLGWNKRPPLSPPAFAWCSRDLTATIKDIIYSAPPAFVPTVLVNGFLHAVQANMDAKDIVGSQDQVHNQGLAWRLVNTRHVILVQISALLIESFIGAVAAVVFKCSKE